MDTRGPRRGPSLSAKMIVTTTMLILFTVVGAGVLGLMAIRRTLDDAATRNIAVFEAGRETIGELGAPLFARTLEKFLIDHGLDAEILEIAREAVGNDTKEIEGKQDLGLRLAYVLDLNQQTVAHCFEGPELTCTAGSHEALGTQWGALTAETWAKAQAAWRSAPPDGSALVRFDVTDGGATFRVFAYPVFVGGTPKPADALAVEPGEHRQGYVVLAYDSAPIAWFAASAAERKAEASHRALGYGLGVGALFAVIGTILAVLQGISITRPIKELGYRADQIARGDLNARVEVKQHDEIGVLAENFNFMADQIAVLLQQTADAARIEQELEVVKAIQETLVPPPSLVKHGRLELTGFYQPAAQTGGDWWTWHPLSNDRTLVVIGDVTGHGVPSAMITAAAKAASDVARFVHGDTVTVTRLLQIMNHAILESAQRRFAMTCFAAIVDSRTRVITFANAGHNLPYLVRGGELAAFTSRGNRLGDDPTSEYEAKTMDLLAGDAIVWYTDGLVECENPDGEQFGEKRFRAVLKRVHALAPDPMRDAIVAEAAAFFGTMPRKDDITMVVGRMA